MKNKSVKLLSMALVFLSSFVFLSIRSEGFCGFLNPTKITSHSSQTIKQAQSQAYGTKPTIAVMEFKNKTGTPNAAYNVGLTGNVLIERDPIGDGMRDQLVTALFETNAFIVVERSALQDILGEQNLGASGRVKRETASEIGEITGADFLIYGAVTEYLAKQAGVGAGVGGKIGIGIAVVGAFLKQAHVAIDIRVVDSRTGVIVNATSVEGRPKDLGGIGGLFGGTLGGIVGAQYKTPIQKAVRACMINAVNWIADNLLEKNAYAGLSNNNSVVTPISNTPPPETRSIEDKLQTLRKLKEDGAITDEQYNKKVDKLLDEEF